MKDKNLLVITSSFPSCLNSYEWIFVREQLLFLSKEFKKVYVIRPQYYIPSYVDVLNILPKSWKEKPIRENYALGNIEVLFPKVSIFGFIKNRQIYRFIKNSGLKFHLIHSHFLYPSWEIGNFLKNKLWLKHYAVWHGFDVYDLPFRNKFWKRKIKNILSRADRIITVSENNVACINQVLDISEKLFHVRNWYNGSKFYVLPNRNNKFAKKYWIPDDKRVLINVGNLIATKNQEYLIEEFSKLNEGYFLIIIWTWTLFSSLQKLIKDRWLQESVLLINGIENTELINLYNLSDIFVFPSLQESTWIAALEAGWCWLPIITYKNGGTENYVSDKYSIVLEKEQSFSEAIESMKCFKNDRENISDFYKKYTWENIIQNSKSTYL